MLPDSARTGSSWRLEEDLDLNGDGDVFDRVLVRYDPRSDRIEDTGLAVGFSGPATDIGRSVQSERWIGVEVREASQGREDLDGDGRDQSTVPNVFDASTGRGVNLGFDGLWMAGLRDQLLGLRLLEGGPALTELVAWDPRARAVRSTGSGRAQRARARADDALVVAAETEET